MPRGDELGNQFTVTRPHMVFGEQEDGSWGFEFLEPIFQEDHPQKFDTQAVLALLATYKKVVAAFSSCLEEGGKEWSQ